MHIKAIILGLITLVVIGGVGYTVMNRADESDSNSSESGSSSSQQTGESDSEKTTIKSLLAQNKNSECTFSGSTDGSTYSGTAYIAGQRIRVDYTGTTDGETQTGHLLQTTDYTYIWTDNSTDGVKVPVAADDEDSNAIESIDQDEEYDFNCSNWSVDESKLTAPGNINFTDLAAFLQQGLSN